MNEASGCCSTSPLLIFHCYFSYFKKRGQQFAGPSFTYFSNIIRMIDQFCRNDITIVTVTYNVELVNQVLVRR